MSSQHTVFIAGHGKLPSGSSAKTAYETLAVTVEVDRRYGVVLDADCTLATTVGRDFVRSLLRGFSLRNDMVFIINEVTQRYFGAVRSALIAALKDLEVEYQRLDRS